MTIIRQNRALWLGFLALLAFALALPAPARAQDNPATMEWNDVRRASFGVQGGYRWLTDSEFAFDKEWMIGGSALYSLGRLSAVRAAVQYGTDNRVVAPSIGWHLSLGQHPATGEASYGATLGYQWWRGTAGREVPADDEFFVGAAVAWPVAENLSIGGGADYGFDSNIIATRVVVSAHFHP